MGRILRLSRLGQGNHFSCHLSRVLPIIDGMSKHAAQRLARYLSNLGHRVRVRQHRSPTGAFYSVEVLAPKRIRT